VLYYKHAKGGNKMTIKNKMVTREQHDAALANKHAAWKWATDKLDDVREELEDSKKIIKVAWTVVAVLATLSALQSIAIASLLLS
jgi:type IV secretory pathway component VirB8